MTKVLCPGQQVPSCLISLISADILPCSLQSLLELVAASALLRSKEQMASQSTASNISLKNGLY